MGLNIGYLKSKTNKESDEVFTPAYAVRPILKYIKPNSTVWCPFDKSDSEFVKQITENNCSVIYSHIDYEDGNFFEYEPDRYQYDYIISNPPFSIKDDILKRLYELNKPFAMLLPLPSLQGQKRFDYIKDCQALIFDKRINFFKNKDTKEILKGISFASIYVCKDFLPRDLIFERLKVE